MVNRCKEIAKSKLIDPPLKLSPSLILHLPNSCDRTFKASYCLIAGIPVANFNPKADLLGDGFIQKLRRAVEGVKVRAAPSDTWLSEIRSRRRKILKLSNMGWWGSPKEKSMILVKLAQPIECGIIMEGGKRLYERVNVSSEEGGEWFTRQLVIDTEANFFMRVEDRV